MSVKSLVLALLSVSFVWGCASAPAVDKPAAPPSAQPTAQVEEKKAAALDTRDEKTKEAEKKFILGLTNMNHGNWKQAEANLSEAIKLNPESYNAHIYLARVYEKNKQSLKAIETYRQAVKLKKDAYDAYYGLVGVYLGMSLPAEAVKVCNEALANGIPESIVSTDLGWSYYLAGDMEHAEARLRVASELLKDGAAPRLDLGLVLFTAGKYDEALGNFQEALKLNPKSVVAPYCLAVVYNKLGMEDKALEALREGVGKDPDMPKKAAFYNSKYFPHADPGDLTKHFEKLEKEKKPSE